MWGHSAEGPHPTASTGFVTHFLTLRAWHKQLHADLLTLAQEARSAGIHRGHWAGSAPGGQQALAAETKSASQGSHIDPCRLALKLLPEMTLRQYTIPPHLALPEPSHGPTVLLLQPPWPVTVTKRHSLLHPRKGRRPGQPGPWKKLLFLHPSGVVQSSKASTRRLNAVFQWETLSLLVTSVF